MLAVSSLCGQAADSRKRKCLVRTIITASEPLAIPVRSRETYPSVRSSAPRALPVIGYQLRAPAVFLCSCHGGPNILIVPRYVSFVHVGVAAWQVVACIIGLWLWLNVHRAVSGFQRSSVRPVQTISLAHASWRYPHIPF